VVAERRTDPTPPSPVAAPREGEDEVRRAEDLVVRARRAVTWGDDAAAEVDYRAALTVVGGTPAATDLIARVLAGLAGIVRARGEIAEADALTARASAALGSGGAVPSPIAEIEVQIERSALTGIVKPEAELRRGMRRLAAIDDASIRAELEVRLLGALGNTQRAAGRYGAAARTLRRAAVLAGVHHGATSPERATVLNDLGVVLKFSGAFAEAARRYAEVERIQDAIGLAESPDRATLLHNQGGLEHARGDLEAAEPLARRSVQLHEATLGAEHLATDLDRVALAAILDGRGATIEAEALLRAALPRLRRRLGRHPEVAVALNNLGAIAQRRGELRAAEACYREALEIKEEVVGPRSPTLAVALNNLATILRRLGLVVEAVATYDRAIELLDGVVEDDHPTLAALRRNRAKMLSD
jgi:tetratricopeptide (TPR) repeat protein